ncbi:hypothetical protein Cs7R123_05770 [Catellatospora sp. TT07R-123]|uniref:DUF6069 family protein n=1 Tax=Catellatospora sp. TT07R-123 TaxID=2733863 RepID=UPI001B21238C|nr:DUF6069 family protein [Catellatospora sp. TT07R-123]GHJ43235.1 hypothetical protein Cs7R123_05770 [Catellatospora sp. TT07R-123]
MTTTDTATKPTTSLGRLLATGVVAIAVASAATSAVAAAGSAAGISLDVSGASIPIMGFGMLTALFSAVGLILAVVLLRTARHPRRVFVWTTVVLTVLSLVPDVLADAAASTRALLMLTHLVAAVIVVPAVARRLPA